MAKRTKAQGSGTNYYSKFCPTVPADCICFNGECKKIKNGKSIQVSKQ